MKKFSALLCVVLLSACGGLLPKGALAPDVYTLNAPQFAANTQAPLPYAVEISLPQVVPGLNTDRIALRQGQNQIDYYADARWGGDLNTVVQAALVDSFDRSGVFKSASNDVSQVKSDYTLALEIRDFQAEYRNGDSVPTAHLRVNATLIDSATKKVIAAKMYEETAPAAANRQAAIVAAFDAAFQKMAFSIIQDTAQASGK